MICFSHSCPFISFRIIVPYLLILCICHIKYLHKDVYKFHLKLSDVVNFSSSRVSIVIDCNDQKVWFGVPILLRLLYTKVSQHLVTEYTTDICMHMWFFP